MSTTEALRTQLDALQTEFHKIEAENRKLKDKNPQGAEALELERELTETQAENVRLAQLLSEAQSNAASDSEKSGEGLSEAHARISELETETEELRRQLAEKSTQLVDTAEAVERATQELERAEAYRRELEGTSSEACREAELELYRAVAAETRKWEKREERLVRRVEELESHTTTEQTQGGAGVGGIGAGGAGVGGVVEEEIRQQLIRQQETAAPLERHTERYVPAQGGGEVLSQALLHKSAAVAPGRELSPRHKRGVHWEPKESSAGGMGSRSLNLEAPEFMPPTEHHPSQISGVLPSTTQLAPPVAGSIARPPVTTSQAASGHGEAVVPVPTLAAAPLDALSMTMLAQQLPPLPNFTGDHADGDGETFEEWLERLELVATTCGWNDQTKLVNLATRLRGSASRYYRTCPPQQRSNYTTLTEALRQRFTPVRIQSVQSSRFHERKQSPTETVDNYAQDLRRLFYQAYSMVQHGGGGSDAMGQSVLAYQFVAGLVDNLKAKLVGCGGSFEELLAKARFEEARLRDVIHVGKSNYRQPFSPPPTKRNLPIDKPMQRPFQPKTDRKCFNCGGTGHFARECTFRGRGAPLEARGRSSFRGPLNNHRPNQSSESRQDAQQRVVSMLQAETDSQQPEQQVTPQTVAHSEEDDEVTQAVSQVMATMHGIKPSRETVTQATLGPTPTSDVCLNGSLVSALLDTGSPISIVSLDFSLKVAAKDRTPEQSPADWGKATRGRLQPTTVSLRSYGGGELAIVSQVQCRITREGYQVDTLLQVQKEAPVSLLLGTDVLPQLGFALIQTSKDQSVDLLGNSSDMSRDPPPGCSVVSQTSTNPTPATDNPLTPKTTVRLIQATRLPARHSKLIRADVEGPEMTSSMLLFQPELDTLSGRGLSMADAVVECARRVTLLVTNHGCESVHLEEGEVIGKMEPATLVETPPEREPPAETIGDTRSNTTACSEPEQRITPGVAAIRTASGEREKRLLIALSLDTEGLTEDSQRDQLRSLVLEFADLFALDSSELGRTSVVTHRINTGDHSPMKQPPRRIPFSLREKVCELTQEMLDDGVIQPSSSPWASPIVLVAKKDGSTRFCVDYRKLNAVTKLDVYPLPRIDDSLDLLAETRFFSTLDLASGYWQVGMEEESQEKTAFTTHAGLFEFTVMPFGLCNAPATFQRLMENVLTGLARERCIVYLDDILVMGRTFEEHLANLRVVFSRLANAGLKLKPSKCELVHREVNFLGYVVSADGISADQKKVSAVIDFPKPKDLKALRAFIGLTSYYRRFVPCFSTVAQPLYQLTRKDEPFVWSDTCEDAFNRLKTSLTVAPVLAYPHFGRDFLLETDASGMGLGAVLSQEQEDRSIRPIAFASRTLQPHEKNYGISELEALGVVWAVKHFRHYLYGHHCTVFTDHEALKSLLNTPQPSGKLARWGMALQELDLKIEYRPGKGNTRADALSRYPVSLLPSDCARTQTCSLVAAMEAQRHDESGEECGEDILADRQRADPHLRDIILYLETGDLPSENRRARELVVGRAQFTLSDCVLYRIEADKTLRIIPPEVDRQKLFREVHEGPFAGHLREAKIHGELSRHYWWPGMRSDLAKWCRSCMLCATRSVGKPVRPPLTPIPVSGPFDRVGVDVLQLPKTSSGKRYAVVFMDYLTKWPEVFATSDQTAPTIAKLLVEEVISRHGVPSQLLSDRGPCFLSRLLLEVCSVMGTKKVNTSAYHPQSDGLVERFNRTLTDMLAKTVKPGVEWDARLPYVLFAYRATLQVSTSESPFFLLYGRDPQLPTELALSPPVQRDSVQLDDYKSRMVRAMSETWELARQSIKKAQGKQKIHHDKTARNAEFKVGDRVFAFMPAMKTGPAYKLARPYKGPYRVMQLYPNGAELLLIDKPRSPPIRVALNRVRRCPEPVACNNPSPATDMAAADPHGPQTATTTTTENPAIPSPATVETDPGSQAHKNLTNPDPDTTVGPWSNRLRSRTTNARGRAD